MQLNFMHLILRSTRKNYLVSVSICIACVLGVLTTRAISGPLDSSIERQVVRTNLGQAVVSVYIEDLDTGEVIADYHGDRFMIPASNMKILTSGAALLTLGNDFVFQTKLVIDHSVAPPKLIVIGDGDPALGDPSIFMGEEAGLPINSLFDQIAQALEDANIDTISELAIDDRVFDRVFTHPCWPIDQLNRWYCAQVSGMNFHTNVIHAYTKPSSSGGTPSLTLVPDAYWFDFQIKGKSNSKKRDTAWVARPTKSNEYVLHGNVSAQSEIPVAIHNPSQFAGDVISSELSKRGIAIGSESQSPRDVVTIIDNDSEYQNSKTLAVITTPLFDVLERTNTDSHNLYAEALLKRVGHEVTSDPGSWENGSSVLRMLISERLGPDAAEYIIIKDGSGMCRENKVSPSLLVNWMASLSRTDHWEMFEDSLAAPGTGTLRKRFTKDTLNKKLRAKSGYLTGTYALSGVLIDESRFHRVAFSIMINDVPAGANRRNAKPLIDQIVRTIDDWMSQSGAQFGG